MLPEASQPRDCGSCWAHERTVLAYESGFAAWIRFGLPALAFGIATRGLANENYGWFFTVSENRLIIFSVLCFAASPRRKRRFAGARRCSGSVIE